MWIRNLGIWIIIIIRLNILTKTLLNKSILSPANKQQIHQTVHREHSPQGRTWMVDPREKFTHKEIKNDYQLEDYLKTTRNPEHTE